MGGSRANPPVLKRLGQHFLTDRVVLQAIADAAAPGDEDAVIEVGPGRGALTDLLAARPNPLIAVELDRALAGNLREKYATNPRVTILQRDILEAPVASLVTGPFVVVGNVPYYITTPILFHVMRAPFPRHAVFLVQREVAVRIIAEPDTSEYGALSANVQAIAHAEILHHVPRTAFRPPPRVDSAVVRITPRVDPLLAANEVDAFRRFVQSLFGMRRKQIANTLRSAAHLPADRVAEVLAGLGIDPRARPETLSPGALAALMRASGAANR